MNIQIPPGHKQILHRQLENFELLIAAREEETSILYVEMQAVGVEVKCLYKPEEGERFLDTVNKIVNQCIKVVMQTAQLELKVRINQEGKNVLN